LTNVFLAFVRKHFDEGLTIGDAHDFVLPDFVLLLSGAIPLTLKYRGSSRGQSERGELIECFHEEGCCRYLQPCSY
jgi:hypothetical protein